MSKKFKVLLLLLALILIAQPAKADGGIPLWIWSTEAILANWGFIESPSELTGFLSLPFACAIPFLFVVFIENLCFRKILKDKDTKIINALIVANLASTLIGGLLLGALIFVERKDLGRMELQLLGPLGPFFMLTNLILCILSIFIECPIINHFLADKFEKKSIRKATILANILSYLLVPIVFIVIAVILIALLSLVFK